jgi:pyruvate kinase
MRRLRSVKIVATLGPASNDYATIRALFEAGADVFRLNMSHGTHSDIEARHKIIRKVEADLGRPIGILADLQGPKLRVGTFANGEEELIEGAKFRMDLAATPGDATRVQLPHPEIFAALELGASLLVNDGKIRLVVDDCGKDFANCTVTVGGTISNRKGVNVPDVVLPLAALSEKDRGDLYRTPLFALAAVIRVLEPLEQTNRFAVNRVGLQKLLGHHTHRWKTFGYFRGWIV